MTDLESQVEITSVAVEKLVEDARRLGLIWTLRPATVLFTNRDSGGAFTGKLTCILDGDSTAMDMWSVCGDPEAGSRVMVMIVPPAGNYVIGRYQRPGKVLTELLKVTASSAVTLSGVNQAMPGTLTTVTTYSDASAYEVCGVFDFRETVAGTTICLGKLFVDGVEQAEQAIFTVTAVTDRATVSQNWAGTLAGTGDHTFELYVIRTAAAGTQIAAEIHTGMTIKIFE